MATTPIKLVYDGLWAVLEAHAGFTALVAVGNRIKMTKGGIDTANPSGDPTKNRTPDKDRVLDGDFPQVRIAPVGGVAYMRTNSTGTRLDKSFRIEARTAEMQYDDLAVLEWETLRAMIDWRTAKATGGTALEDMTFGGNAFVTDISLMQEQNRVFDENSMKGWQALWIGRVRMDFDTSDL